MAAAAVLVFFVVPLPPRSLPPQGFVAFRSQGALQAGAAKVEIALPEHPILAGYAGHHQAVSKAGPVYARAIALRAGSGPVAIIANVDTLLIPPELFIEGCALVAATHTHTGPGGIWDNALAGYLGAGAPDGKQREAVRRALEEAVKQARAALGPAALRAAREDFSEGPARARRAGPIDPGLVALRLTRPDQGVVATVVIYGMHATSAPREVLSPDWPGGLSDVLFLQGAEGNATFAREGEAAPAIAREAAKLLAAAPAQRELSLTCESKPVLSPRAVASPAVAWPLRRAFANALTLFGPLPIASQVRLRIGDLELLGVPGEPVGELGLHARPTVLIGLANGYLGYVETPERWAEGKGEAAKTYFGPGLAHALGLWPR